MRVYEGTLPRIRLVMLAIDGSCYRAVLTSWPFNK
jgi:hypothetical protein